MAESAAGKQGRELDSKCASRWAAAPAHGTAGLRPPRQLGRAGRRLGHRRGGGTCRSVSPRGRCDQLQSADERRAVGRALRGAAAGVRGAGLPPRRGRGAHAAPAGDSAPRAALPGHRDLLLACRLALSSRLIYFFPHLYFDPLGFFFSLPFLQSLPTPQFPPSLFSLDIFFFFFFHILLF